MYKLIEFESNSNNEKCLMRIFSIQKLVCFLLLLFVLYYFIYTTSVTNQLTI